MMAGAWGVAGGFAAAEVCAPLLVLCWLCCWPADDSSDSSSGKHPTKPVVTQAAGSRKRADQLSGRRLGSSAVSLHLPSTSGIKQPLSAHRSHEEIRSRRKSQHEDSEENRYHSAPSVIDEVLHRRDWERSNRDLYIPLRSDDEARDSSNEDVEVTHSREAVLDIPCKKHYTNIKSSRKKKPTKESLNEDIKDCDATEMTSFYIGESSFVDDVIKNNDIDYSSQNNNDKKIEERNEVSTKVKESKQCLNESIKIKERGKPPLVTLTEFQVAGFDDDNEKDEVEVDRSGAVHHTVESRSSLYNPHSAAIPPPSVEAVGYDSDVSYLAEDDVLGAWRLDPSTETGAGPAASRPWGRARHGSAGDVLAPTIRPHSAALSESDLDFELEECDEPPPAYDQLHLLSSRDRKETAI